MIRYCASFALLGFTSYLILALLREAPLEELLGTAGVWAIGFAFLGAVISIAVGVMFEEKPKNSPRQEDEPLASKNPRGPISPVDRVSIEDEESVSVSTEPENLPR